MNEYQELTATHQALQEKLSNQPIELSVDEVQTFVRQMREAGKRIRDVRQREQLRAMMRVWGAFVFERAGYYPETQLASYEPPSGPDAGPVTEGRVPRWLLWASVALLIVILAAGAYVALTRSFSLAAVATPTATGSVLVSPLPPTNTATPSAIAGKVVIESASLYAEPNPASTKSGSIPRGLQLTVIARTSDGTWLKVRAADETIGWILANEIDLDPRRVPLVPTAIVVSVPTSAPTVAPGGPGITPTATAQLSAITYVVQVRDDPLVRNAGGLRIRAERSLESEERGVVKPGDRLTVFDRAVQDDTAWLLVQSAGGTRGWARENQGSTLLVERVAPTTATLTVTPAPTASATPTLPPTATGAAGRPTPNAIAVNVIARVTPPEGVTLKVRQSPSVQATIVVELAQDAQVTIVGGPQTANGITWWQVDNGQGIVGWSAEAAGDTRYLVPIGWAR